MKKSVAHIVSKIPNLKVFGSLEKEIMGMTLDSRKVKADFLFAALKGTQVDGKDFIPKAIELGATVILCHSEVTVPNGITLLVSDSPEHDLALMAAAFYDYPSEKIKLIGVTGTNGKTSIATMLFEAFTKMGDKCGLISTVVNKIQEEDIPSTHTTPDVITLNALLSQMVSKGCEYVFMEVSSHSLDQKRVAGLQYAGAIFTNISHDHLDYHQTFANYIKAKQQLFDQLPSDAFALYNADDRNGKIMVQNSKATRYTYALKSMADFKVKILEKDFAGMLLKIDDQELWIGLSGEFNAYNILAVYGCAFLLNKDRLEILKAISAIGPVLGRFEQIRLGGITAIIDYAHTPDALQNVLDTINAIRTGNEQLITVVGCGGNRDKEKRPVMASIAATHSTMSIFTSDNPRDEDPEVILEEMGKGVAPEMFKKTIKIANRSEAIKLAVTLAQPNDVILIAGKGHEKYQEIKGVKHPFDDKEIVIQHIKTIKSI